MPYAKMEVTSTPPGLGGRKQQRNRPYIVLSCVRRWLMPVHMRTNGSLGSAATPKPRSAATAFMGVCCSITFVLNAQYAWALTKEGGRMPLSRTIMEPKHTAHSPHSDSTLNSKTHRWTGRPINGTQEVSNIRMRGRMWMKSSYYGRESLR